MVLKTGIENILLCLLSSYFKRYRDWLAGRKKLQKLMFLVDYDIEGEKIRKLGFSGAKFKVLVYGPYSDQVADAIETLVEKGKVEEMVITNGFSPRRLISKYMEELRYEEGRIYLYKPRVRNVPRLPSNVKQRIEEIVEKYGSYTGGELEKLVTDKLGLTPERKEKYFGISIDEYISKLA